MLAPIIENMMGLVLPSLQIRTLRKMCQGLKERKRRLGSLLDKMHVAYVEKEATIRRNVLTSSNG
jgi:hypothetical protein